MRQEETELRLEAELAIKFLLVAVAVALVRSTSLSKTLFDYTMPLRIHTPADDDVGVATEFL